MVFCSTVEVLCPVSSTLVDSCSVCSAVEVICPVCSALVCSCSVCAAVEVFCPVCSALVGSCSVCSVVEVFCSVCSALVGSCSVCSAVDVFYPVCSVLLDSCSALVGVWMSLLEGDYVTNLVYALPFTHPQRSPIHHMDSCTTLHYTTLHYATVALHLGQQFPSSIALTTHTQLIALITHLT